MPQSNRFQLRQAAREIFNAALLSVDAREVVRQSIKLDQNEIRIVNTFLDGDTRIYVIAIGKAAGPMANALNEILGNRIVRGVITAPVGTTDDLTEAWERFHGGHPFPNVESLAAAEASFRILDQADTEAATVIFAISGGGSAMLEWPVDQSISLEDLHEANRVLVNCGATIAEVNTVRRAFSAVKGGKLALRASKVKDITLIISDTNNGDEASVASGPTLRATSSTTAIEIVQKFNLAKRLPEPILQAIKTSVDKSDTIPETGDYYVLVNNHTALEAAARHASGLGFETVIAEAISEQPIAEGCRALIDQFNKLRPPVCLISGGEFSCPVVGDGLGGRNSETVLRCVRAIAGEEDDIVVLSAGTDGLDGNSPATGALADNATQARAKELGLDIEEFLKRSDSYSFFSRLGDTIITGPTGTNVRDVRLLLKN